MKTQYKPHKDFFLFTKPVNTRYERMIAIMHDRGYSHISKLAEDLDLSRSLISQIIHGHIEPTNELKIKIAQLLKTDSRVLFPDRKEAQYEP